MCENLRFFYGEAQVSKSSREVALESFQCLSLHLLIQAGKATDWLSWI